MKTILGLGGSTHDFSAALLCGNEVICAIEDERLTGRKHGVAWSYEVPCLPAAEYCLREAGIGLEEVDTIIANDVIPMATKRYFPNIKTYNHHMLHAASNYFFSGENELGIIVLDGCGSILNAEKSSAFENRETISFFQCKNHQIEEIGKMIGNSPKELEYIERPISNSLGYFYSAITRIVEFRDFDEGKTMGLAAYGNPSFYDLMERSIHLGDEFSTCFSFDPIHSGLFGILSNEVRAKRTFQVRADIAASAQLIFIKCVKHLTRLLTNKIVNGNVGISGGCGLNAVCNGILQDELHAQGKKLCVYPHTDDAGLAYGAIAFEYYRDGPKKQIEFCQERKLGKLRGFARPGKIYSETDVIEAINQHYPEIEYERLGDPSERLANLLYEDNIIGFFEGPSEFGPRALGGRSILAPAHSASIREQINRRIKFREPFRPIAPMILRDFYSDFFHGDPDRKYMLSVAFVRQENCSKIPAVIHMDQTARVQVIGSESQTIESLLRKYYEISGVPIICNTSFNSRGMPIVETPKEALKTFLEINLDYLYLQGYLIKKANLPKPP